MNNKIVIGIAVLAVLSCVIKLGMADEVQVICFDGPDCYNVSKYSGTSV